MLIIVCIIFIFNYKKTFYTNWYNYCKRDFKFFNSTEELIKALSISKNDKNCKYDNYTEDMLNEITANNFNKITPREYNTSDEVLISSIHDKINIKMYDVYSRFHNYFTNTDNFKWNIICIINCGNFKLIPIQYTANTPVKIENNTPKFMYNIQENAFIDAAIIRNYNYNLFENNMTVVLNKCIVMYHGYIIDEINMSKFVLLYEKILNRHKRILNLKEDNE
jgi:hypothetical protein